MRSICQNSHAHHSSPRKPSIFRFEHVTNNHFWRYIGGSSRNKLVIFQDGTYLELINWIKEPAEFFDWAPKSPGLIDFALTSTTTAHNVHGEVTSRLEKGGVEGMGLGYKQPLAGGRKRKDGRDVKWFVTKPQFRDVVGDEKELYPTGRLDAPFFCHDVTDRELRIPPPTKEGGHDSGAMGIGVVEVLVPKEKVGEYVKMYEGILGVKGEERGEGVWWIGMEVPTQEKDLRKTMEGRVGVEVRGPRDQSDAIWMRERGVGIRRIRLLTEDGKGHGAVVELAEDGIGETIVLI
jgi:hypothetical protein